MVSLDITGSGTLYVNGNAKNGVKGASEAVVTVDGGTVKIIAANNGLASDGSVTVNGGALGITSQNDGIKSEPDEDDTASAGTVSITGGKVTLNTTGDGIQATNEVSITGGTWGEIMDGIGVPGKPPFPIRTDRVQPFGRRTAW